MAIDQDIQGIELNIDSARKMIEKNDRLNRLRENPDFKAIFIDGYLKDEAARLVGLKADPEMQADEQQAFINNAIIAIGVFNQYLMTISQMSKMAENGIRHSEQTRETLLNEAQSEAVIQ